MQPCLGAPPEATVAPATAVCLALLQNHSEEALHAARASLPGVAALARRAGADDLLAAIQAYLSVQLRQLETPERLLLRWLQRAEALRLKQVQAACVEGLARVVLAAPSPVAALLHIVRVTRCGVETKRALLRATRLGCSVITAYMEEVKVAAAAAKPSRPRPTRAQSAPVAMLAWQGSTVRPEEGPLEAGSARWLAGLHRPPLRIHAS